MPGSLGHVCELDNMLVEYYAARGWENGVVPRGQARGARHRVPPDCQRLIRLPRDLVSPPPQFADWGGGVLSWCSGNRD